MCFLMCVLWKLGNSSNKGAKLGTLLVNVPLMMKVTIYHGKQNLLTTLSETFYTYLSTWTSPLRLCNSIKEATLAYCWLDKKDCKCHFIVLNIFHYNHRYVDWRVVSLISLLQLAQLCWSHLCNKSSKLYNHIICLSLTSDMTHRILSW